MIRAKVLGVYVCVTLPPGSGFLGDEGCTLIF